MPFFIPNDFLSPFIGEEYVGRARRERRFELASWDNIQQRKKQQQQINNKSNQNRPDDLAFILGLSWRFRSSTSDVDLVGGFDARPVLALRKGVEHLWGLVVWVWGVLSSWLVRGGGWLLAKDQNLRIPGSRLWGSKKKNEAVEVLNTNKNKNENVDWKVSGDLERQQRQRQQHQEPLQRQRTRNRKRKKKEKAKDRILPSLHDALHDALPTHSRLRYPTSDHDERRRRRDCAAILAQVDREAVATLCLRVFEEHRRGRSSTRLPLPLPEVDDPILGTAHVLWPVRFADHRRTHWIVKVPVNGTPDTWDELGADALRGEALVLRMLGGLGMAVEDGCDDADDDVNKKENGVRRKRENNTSKRRRFPAPLPIQVDPGAHNAIHAPYLVMEFVEGVRLDEYWFAGTSTGCGNRDIGQDKVIYSPEQILLRRRRVLESLVRAMLRLSSACETAQGGAPVINEEDWRVSPEVAAPARHLDIQTMLGRWFVHGDGDSSIEYDCGNEGDDEEGEETEGYDDGVGRENISSGIERTPIYTAIWPHNNPRDAYTAFLDRYPPETEAAAGVDALLRLLIKMIREPSNHQADYLAEPDNESNKPFVLAHPDLQLHHIVVCPSTGQINGIIGWDGVRAVPKSTGNEALPRWLVRDFNPFSYRWTPEVTTSAGGRVVVGNGNQRQGRMGGEPDDPPWVLAELRCVYVDFVGALKREKKGGGGGGDMRAASGIGGGGDGGGGGGDGKGEVDLTRQSLLALTLDEAVRDPRCRSAVLRRVLEKCSRQFEMFDYEGIVDVLGSGGRLDVYTMKCLRRNVRELIEKGFVRGAVVW